MSFTDPLYSLLSLFFSLSVLLFLLVRYFSLAILFVAHAREAALEAARRDVTLLSSSHKRAEETVSSLRADLETERATGVQRSDDLGASAAALEAARTEVADLLVRPSIFSSHL